MLDIKWYTGRYLKGLSPNPLKFKEQSDIVKAIAELSYSFHNLPIFLEQDIMDKFDEEIFWKDLEETIKRHQLLNTEYRELFLKKLDGENIHIYDAR